MSTPVYNKTFADEIEDFLEGIMTLQSTLDCVDSVTAMAVAFEENLVPVHAHARCAEVIEHARNRFARQEDEASRTIVERLARMGRAVQRQIDAEAAKQNSRGEALAAWFAVGIR